MKSFVVCVDTIVFMLDLLEKQNPNCLLVGSYIFDRSTAKLMVFSIPEVIRSPTAEWQGPGRKKYAVRLISEQRLL